MTDQEAQTVARVFLDQKLTLAVAESCTGGLVGHRLTGVAGSSEFFMGGVVAYAYEVKERVLGVQHQTLLEHGAVSAETAIEMAQGVKKLLATDYAVSITGIAGPGGGTPDKPVGLTYIAVVSPLEAIWRRHVWQGDRDANKLQSADAALTLLADVVERESVRQAGRSQFMDTPIVVEANLSDSRILPRSVAWGGKLYQVVSVGRQWPEKDGTHVLVELHDGSRMEIKLLPDLQWRGHRLWPVTLSA